MISINVNTSQPVVAQPAPEPRPRRRYRRYDDYGPEPPAGGASMGLGITSMVLGIVALPFAIFPCLGIISLPIAGLAVVLGLIGLVLANSERGSSPGFAIAGLVTGGGAILLALIWLLAWRDAWGRRAWWW
jgi:hypothetical protein